MGFGRRRFLLCGIGGGATVLLGTASPTAASVGSTAQVWRLSANWGYAVPPKGRTRCKCSACHDHAAHVIFSTSSAAIGGRIHPCCVCQPFSIEATAAGFAALFPAGAVRADLRAPGVRAAFEAAINGLAPAPAPAPAPGPTSGPTAAGRVPTDASSPPTAPAASGQRGTLPVTGSTISSLLVGAAVLTATGATLVTGTSPTRTSQAHGGVESETPAAS